MRQEEATVIAVQPVCPGIFRVQFRAPQISGEARPGQFVMVKCGTDLTLRRPLSIHRAEPEGTLTLLFAVTGKGTSWLSERTTGAKVDLLGPMGNGFSLPDDVSRILLVAGGIGIAPLAFLAHELVAQNKTVTILQGAVNAQALLPATHIPPGPRIVCSTDDGSFGSKGIVTDLLPQYLEQTQRIYACGPLSMYRSIAKAVERPGIKVHVEVSLEVRMGCGMGTCYGCSIRTKSGMRRVCLDGPVFDLSDILWEEVRVW